jgi:hypothetical protein
VGRGPTEKQFMAQVVQLARLCSWMVYHTHDSRRSAAGFPDLVLLRGAEMVAAELKAGRGRTTPEQDAWLAAFGRAGAAVFVWRPADWPEIERVLAHGED